MQQGPRTPGAFFNPSNNPPSPLDYRRPIEALCADEFLTRQNYGHYSGTSRPVAFRFGPLAFGRYMLA